MNNEQQPQRDWRNGAVIGLGIVVTLLLGVIIGFVVTGGLNGEEAVGATTTTTPVVGPTTTPSPATTSPGASVSTIPGSSSTQPEPAATVPPDTQVSGQITYTASEDTYTDSSDPADNNGDDTVIELVNDPPELKLGLVRFEVVGIPDGQSVTGATLRVFIEETADDLVSVHVVENDWSESETTAGNAPLIGEAIAAIPAGSAELAFVEVDVTSAVPGNGTIDFYLATSSNTTWGIASRESQSPPMLTVTYSG